MFFRMLRCSKQALLAILMSFLIVMSALLLNAVPATAQWSDWENLGGVLTSGPSAASWSANRLDVFVRGLDNAMWHKWWNGSSWSDWENLGGALSSDPDCVSWSVNRIDCFVRGLDNALWHKWWPTTGPVLPPPPFPGGTAQISVDRGCGSFYNAGETVTTFYSISAPASITIYDFDPAGVLQTISGGFRPAGTYSFSGRVRGMGIETLVIRAVTATGVATASCSYTVGLSTSFLGNISLTTNRGCGGLYSTGESLTVTYSVLIPVINVRIFAIVPEGVINMTPVPLSATSGTVVGSAVGSTRGDRMLVVTASTPSGILSAACKYTVP